MSTKPHIFVSYSEIDDQSISDIEIGWVSSLIDRLIYLLSIEGEVESYSIWMPKFAPGNLPIEQVWQQELAKANIFLIILSKSYLKSPTCQEQLSTFIERFGLGSGRIFIVERTKIDPSVYPSNLQGLRGYHFWQAEDDGHGIKTLGFPKASSDDVLYYERLQYLANDLAHTINAKSSSETISPVAISKPSNEPSEKAAIPPLLTNLPAVFLAEVSDDLTTQRAEVKTYLQQYGIQVFPETVPYYFPNREQLQQQIGTDMQHCGLFVQLLSDAIPARPEGMTTPHLQIELAQQAHHLQVLQWRSPDLDLSKVTDEQQQALLESEYVVVSSLQQFKQLIIQRCEKMQKQQELEKQQSLKRAEAGDNKLVFINANRRDQLTAEIIEQHLLNSGMETSLPIFENSVSSEEVREDLDNNLNACDAVILLFGNAELVWVRAQLLNCRKVGKRRKAEYPLKIIALLAEDSKPDIRITLENLQRFSCDNLETTNCIEKVIKALPK